MVETLLEPKVVYVPISFLKAPFGEWLVWGKGYTYAE
jgi:hypothetical protein